MKHLLNGVAIAAAVVIAAPAWAQNAPSAPAAPAAPAAAPAANAPAAAMAPKQMHRKTRTHTAAVHGKMHHMTGAGDSMTEQLNKEELTRIQGGAMAPPPPPPPPGK